MVYTQFPLEEYEVLGVSPPWASRILISDHSVFTPAWAKMSPNWGENDMLDWVEIFFRKSSPPPVFFYRIFLYRKFCVIRGTSPEGGMGSGDRGTSPDGGMGSGDRGTSPEGGMGSGRFVFSRHLASLGRPTCVWLSGESCTCGNPDCGPAERSARGPHGRPTRDPFQGWADEGQGIAQAPLR